MADEDGRSGTSSFDGVIREALGGSIAPPGLAKRIRAALDDEDARRARGMTTALPASWRPTGPCGASLPGNPRRRA
jgi:hypothetical protein